MWLMCLPVGAHQDHPYRNVFALDACIRPVRGAVLANLTCLIYSGQDVLRTRQMQYRGALKKAAGKDVTIVRGGAGG